VTRNRYDDGGLAINNEHEVYSIFYGRDG
jgi:hypothetical protein